MIKIQICYDEYLHYVFQNKDKSYIIVTNIYDILSSGHPIDQDSGDDLEFIGSCGTHIQRGKYGAAIISTQMEEYKIGKKKSV